MDLHLLPCSRADFWPTEGLSSSTTLGLRDFYWPRLRLHSSFEILVSFAAAILLSRPQFFALSSRWSLEHAVESSLGRWVEATELISSAVVWKDRNSKLCFVATALASVLGWLGSINNLKWSEIADWSRRCGYGCLQNTAWPQSGSCLISVESKTSMP